MPDNETALVACCELINFAIIKHKDNLLYLTLISICTCLSNLNISDTILYPPPLLPFYSNAFMYDCVVRTVILFHYTVQ
jgi:hypothetical protein